MANALTSRPVYTLAVQLWRQRRQPQPGPGRREPRRAAGRSSLMPISASLTM